MVGHASASSVGFAPPNDTITLPPALRIARTSDWIVVPFASRSRPIGPMAPQASAQMGSPLAFMALTTNASVTTSRPAVFPSAGRLSDSVRLMST